MQICPFCSPECVPVTESELAIAIHDSFPVSPGHVLIIPRRHFASYFDATDKEKRALWKLVDDIKSILDVRFQPDAYNVGINCGEAAGQTVQHLHIHVIPRYAGDIPDPRGGVRHVISGMGNYLAPPDLARGGDDHFIAHLRPLFREAAAIDMVVSFVRSSGLRAIEGDLLDARDRGIVIRVLTGDYLDITEVEALNLLLDWSSEGRISTFVYEGEGESFHPKSYIFHTAKGGCAFVGSSNLSSMALGRGIEWNYRVESRRDPEGFKKIASSFVELLGSPRVKPLDTAWIKSYRKRCVSALRSISVPEMIELENPVDKPVPTLVQQQAIEKLEETREKGYRSGLVVLATGLGKTYLAAFDSLRFKRVLFVAHREEILTQSQAVFRRLRPEAIFGAYSGKERSNDAEVVFASVQSLSKKANLDDFERQAFDYIVIDEFHHACASTYRKILSYFTPGFLLGITATPERMDQADLLDLCENNLVYEKNLVEGITLNLLVPFRYYGITDPVDYSNIPWRSGRFDIRELEAAVDNDSRAGKALECWRERAGSRTLAFCCTTVHADYMACYFRENGDVRAVSVHSGQGSAPRAASLEQLRRGDIDVIFAVDIFNEGLDVPDLDTVLMLRPTESPVIFLQQLGRGLRKAEGKEHLVVIDFIGNHRSFLMKPRLLLSLGSGSIELSKALERLQKGDMNLPDSCTMEFELGLIDMMSEFIQMTGIDAIEGLYREFSIINGRRMTAGELYRSGLSMKSIGTRYGSWFEFVRAQGDLSDKEAGVLEHYTGWFRELENSPLKKSFRMIALKALIDEQAIGGSIEIGKLADRCYQIFSRNPVLMDEIDRSSIKDPMHPERDSWFVFCETNLIGELTGEFSGSGIRSFIYKKPVLSSLMDIAEDVKEVFADMTQELVDYRLSMLEKKLSYTILSGGKDDSFRAKIVRNMSADPILFLPDRKKHNHMPSGPTRIIIDGKEYLGNFVKIALNVVKEPDGKKNVLPDILRKWFGEHVGSPGTAFHVVFEKDNDKWVMKPDKLQSDISAEESQIDSNIIPFPFRHRVPFYRELKAACGAFRDGIFTDGRGTDDMAEIATSRKNIDISKHFMVTAQGTSMDGGSRPIKDGDHLLMEWIKKAGPEEVQNRICLVITRERDDSVSAVIKRIVRKGSSFYLKSENPPEILDEVDFDRIVPVACFIEVVELN